MDQTKSCIDCGDEFVIEAGEAKHLLSTKDEFGNYLKLPKRCQSCRAKRKMQNNGGREMRKFPHNRSSFTNKKGNRWED